MGTLADFEESVSELEAGRPRGGQEDLRAAIAALVAGIRGRQWKTATQRNRARRWSAAWKSSAISKPPRTPPGFSSAGSFDAATVPK